MPFVPRRGRRLHTCWKFLLVFRTRKISSLAIIDGTAQTCVLHSAAYSSISKQISSDLGLPLLMENDDELSSGRFTDALVVSSAEAKHDQNGNDYVIGLANIERPHRLSTKRRKTASILSNPFVVDFVPSPASPRGRRLAGEAGRDLLVRALGKHACDDCVIVDATAGWGADALVMAQAAVQVIMVERNSIVATLLADGLRRLQSAGQRGNGAAAGLAQRLSLQHGNAVRILQDMTGNDRPRPDIVYLDPMFPIRTKIASVKKPMQTMHRLLYSQSPETAAEHQHNEQVLLQAALHAATTRVVVKRPQPAPSIIGTRAPSYSVNGSTNRWDVYITAMQ